MARDQRHAACAWFHRRRQESTDSRSRCGYGPYFGESRRIARSSRAETGVHPRGGSCYRGRPVQGLQWYGGKRELQSAEAQGGRIHLWTRYAGRFGFWAKFFKFVNSKRFICFYDICRNNFAVCFIRNGCNDTVRNFRM